jgi:hypothetical protein
MAQEFPAPTMKVGDRHTYRISGGPDKPTTYTETVVEVLPGGRYRIRLEGTSQPGLREFDGPGNLVQPPPWPSLKPMQYPVAVGKAWTHTVADTPAQSRSIAYKAVAIESVKVAGGALDCVRIEGRRHHHGLGRVDPVAGQALVLSGRARGRAQGNTRSHGRARDPGAHRLPTGPLRTRT